MASTTNSASGSGGQPSSVALNDLVAKYRSGFRLGPLSVRLSVGVTAVVGSNGAGKSTLLRCLAGIQAHGGSIKGVGVSSHGYMPQDPVLPTNARSIDVLVHAAWVQGLPHRQLSAAAKDALQAVGLEDRSSDRVKRLSGGMRRRLAFAQATVHQPALLLLDEPTVGLDPAQRLGMRSLISNYAAHGVVISSTHLLEDVRAVGGAVMILADGELRFFGTVDDLNLGSPTDFESTVAKLMEADELREAI